MPIYEVHVGLLSLLVFTLVILLAYAISVTLNLWSVTDDSERWRRWWSDTNEENKRLKKIISKATGILLEEEEHP
jgi:hypothetical protein